MSVEPITISVNNLSSQARARLPTEREITRIDRKDANVEGDEEEAVKVEKYPDLSRMTELVADVQENLNMVHDVDLHFSVHEASGKLMVTVIDASTGEVIREVPPSEILELAAKIDEMVGLIFDQEG
jgi:flagellar protein FlaG